MNPIRYHFNDRPKLFDATALSAQQAGEALAALEAEAGSLTPPLVVEAARPSEAPLHPAFEWDDAIAGERYREHQASALIKTVEVLQPAASQPRREPAYVQLTAQPRRYGATRQVVRQDEAFEAAFCQACERITAAQKALEALLEVARRERRSEAQRYGAAATLLRRAQGVIVRGGADG